MVPRRVGRTRIIARVKHDGLGVSATVAISAECRGAGNAQFEDEGSEARLTNPCSDALMHYFAPRGLLALQADS